VETTDGEPAHRLLEDGHGLRETGREARLRNASATGERLEDLLHLLVGGREVGEEAVARELCAQLLADEPPRGP
jgi:hypothetical protein